MGDGGCHTNHRFWETDLIVVAKYPGDFKMEQQHLPFAGTPGYTSSHKSYQQAFNTLAKHGLDYKMINHYIGVIAWCSNHLQGPWDCNHNDILHEGVRVRIGTELDAAYFLLKWNG